MTRFTITKEAVANEDSSDEESKEDDNDSIMDDEDSFQTKTTTAFCYLEDSKKGGRKITTGSKIKLQLSDVQVSEGTILSYATVL